MDLALLVTSIALGLTVAAPIGPMSLLCINRTLHVGRANGLVFGAGIAAADCTYAALASFGLVGLSNVLADAGQWLKILGAFLLIYLGVGLVRGRRHLGAPGPIRNSGLGAFASAYGLTLANPPTILFFAGVFASVATLSSGIQSVTFSAGVFAGSMLWWAVLTLFVTKSARALTAGAMAWIGRVSGLVLIGFACYGLFSVFRGVYYWD
ncbi:MAG: LysE family translocator [Gammaproteobacteria bacterium]|nr:LysE family translocator [Gammaproteobacteria bacterium]